jgi:hypothetical protein
VPSKYIFPRNTGCACYHLKNGEHLQCTELVMQRTSDISWRSLFCELCYQHNGVDICLCECAGCMPKSTDAASTDGNAFPAEELVSIPEGAPAPDPVEFGNYTCDTKSALMKWRAAGRPGGENVGGDGPKQTSDRQCACGNAKPEGGSCLSHVPSDDPSLLVAMHEHAGEDTKRWLQKDEVVHAVRGAGRLR